MAERNNKMQRDPALLDIEFEVYNDCMRPQPSMWGQKSLFNNTMQAIQYLVICNRGWTDFNERAYINFFFKELNILLQSTKGKPGYSCSLKCEFKKKLANIL